MTPEEIARALASLRHDDPLPDDVARRLDDRLAALHAERDGADRTETDLTGTDRTRTPSVAAPDGEAPASPRRRRVLWVAAAACMVALAGGQLLGDGVAVMSGSGGSSSADSESSDAGGSSASRETAIIEPGSPVPLTSGGFARQARTAAQAPLRAEGGAQSGTEGDTEADQQDPSPTADRRGITTLRVGPQTCRTPPAGPGSRLLPATYDGRPAVLEIAAGRATLWACDGRRVLNESDLAP